MNKPTNAPGCFAAASVFSHDSEVCRKCCAFDACAAASMETLQRIRGLIDVSDLLKRHEKAKKAARKIIQENDEKAAAALPPGNNQPPLVGAERKTEVVKITFDTSADEERIIATLPVKVRPIALSFCKSGMLNRVKKELCNGRNALAETGPGWLRVAIDRLLAGGIVRSELREAMREELGWEDATCGPHTSMAIAFFLAFGVAQETEGRFVLVPATA